MNQLYFEGVRCFYDKHECPLKPVTLLVGENSSGKSTFLALTRIAWDIVEGNLSGDIFNEDPFLLGSYEQIASFRGGKAGRAKSFSIGLRFSLKSTLRKKISGLFSDEAKITARFVSKGAEPQMEEWRFECGRFSLKVNQAEQKEKRAITINTPIGTHHIPDKKFFRNWNCMELLQILHFILFRDEHDEKETSNKSVITEGEADELAFLSRAFSSSLRNSRPYAFAPIRTRPLRTYDPLKDVPKPEGTHVPMVLARTFLEQSSGGKSLQSALNEFGVASGLFSSVDVKRKGHKESDPFQIAIKTVGQSFNLVDVGYGVSQVLPIVVDVLENTGERTFLLQQPEVHLHPRAQAELGSFLATLAKKQRKQFVIETHSDYLIDRVRMDIRDKKNLNPDDMAILYFEKSQGGVKIHHLKVDEYGNIVDAPPTYRQFFMAEERRKFGV
jgi:predicted ATPase